MFSRRRKMDPGRRSSGGGGPRLDRRNAAKRIDYDAGGEVSTSWSSSSSTSSDAAGVLRASRSLDLPAGGERSFRIGGVGGSTGDVEALCRSLGLNGPEDFTISEAAWNARRQARSDSAPEPAAGASSSAATLDNTTDGKNLPSNSSSGEAEEKTNWSGSNLNGDDIPFPPRLDKEIDFQQSFPKIPEDGDDDVMGISSSAEEEEDGPLPSITPRILSGIRGVRPPVLAPPLPPSPDAFLTSGSALLPLPLPPARRGVPLPPAVVAAPAVASLHGNDISEFARDIVRSYAPKEDELEICCDKQKHVDSDEEDEEQRDKVHCETVGMEDRVLRVGETSEGLTWTSSNEDDTSSTTTETVFIISPNALLKGRIKSWERGALLGSGSFGTVYEAISDEGVFFAIKEVSLLDQGINAQQCISQLEQEVALLSQFEHENIVQYYGTEKGESKLYIFLELVTQGSLASLYQKYNLGDSQVSAYTRQILKGLVYLHERNVVHRDIKCANILVHATGSVKLADFGLAKEMDKINKLKSCRGSVYWMAPEVVNPRKTYGRAADIWSLGCTVLEMLTRQIPYNVEWANALFLIGRGEQPPIPSHLSNDARDFISQCVRVNPDERPTALELLEHPFVNKQLRSSFGSGFNSSGFGSSPTKVG